MFRLLVLFVFLSVLSGCDRTVSDKKTATHGPGGTSVEEKKTVQHPDGTVTTTTEKKTQADH